MTSGSNPPPEPDRDELPNPNLPREEPLTIAGVSSIGKYKNPNVRKSVRPTPRPLTGRLAEEKEEKSKKDRKDEPRVVEHFIMRNADVKNKVLLPIYNNLKKLKEKKKYSKDIAAKHLYYVVNYAIRKLNIVRFMHQFINGARHSQSRTKAMPISHRISCFDSSDFQPLSYRITLSN